MLYSILCVYANGRSLYAVAGVCFFFLSLLSVFVCARAFLCIASSLFPFPSGFSFSFNIQRGPLLFPLYISLVFGDILAYFALVYVALTWYINYFLISTAKVSLCKQIVLKINRKLAKKSLTFLLGSQSKAAPIKNS